MVAWWIFLAELAEFRKHMKQLVLCQWDLLFHLGSSPECIPRSWPNGFLTSDSYACSKVGSPLIVGFMCSYLMYIL